MNDLVSQYQQYQDVTANDGEVEEEGEEGQAYTISTMFLVLLCSWSV
ncbi:hypothetical protein C0J45_4917 [Silurus meridionalis]|nr:hypothetical protein C0J45_4917 [Silurus meridionalis]